MSRILHCPKSHKGLQSRIHCTVISYTVNRIWILAEANYLVLQHSGAQLRLSTASSLKLFNAALSSLTFIQRHGTDAGDPGRNGKRHPGCTGADRGDSFFADRARGYFETAVRYRSRNNNFALLSGCSAEPMVAASAPENVSGVHVQGASRLCQSVGSFR